MAAALPAEDAAHFRAFLDNPTWDLAHALPVDGDLRLELNAIIANTAVPTIVHGGHQINVIPSEITLDVDGRILPGQDGEAFRADIQRLVGDDIEVELVSGFNGLEASPSSPFFDVLATTVRRNAPGNAPDSHTNDRRHRCRSGTGDSGLRNFPLAGTGAAGALQQSGSRS